MKYFIITSIIIALTIASVSCLSYQKSQHKTATSNNEYIVQFEKDIHKKTIESVFDKYDIRRFSYITSSRKRGYILLIRLKSSMESTLEQLRQEKSIKNIDPNYEINIEKSQ